MWPEADVVPTFDMAGCQRGIPVQHGIPSLTWLTANVIPMIRTLAE